MLFYLCVYTTLLTYFLLFASVAFCEGGGKHRAKIEKRQDVSHLFTSLFAKMATFLK